MVSAFGDRVGAGRPGLGRASARSLTSFFGGHYVTKPIWDWVRFQPNVEAGFGDDLTVVAFNVEFAYWMPIGADWHVRVAAAMNLFSGNGKNHDEDVERG
jgi:hypothetical protein